MRLMSFILRRKLFYSLRINIKTWVFWWSFSPSYPTNSHKFLQVFGFKGKWGGAIERSCFYYFLSEDVSVLSSALSTPTRWEENTWVSLVQWKASSARNFILPLNSCVPMIMSVFSLSWLLFQLTHAFKRFVYKYFS